MTGDENGPRRGSVGGGGGGLEGGEVPRPLQGAQPMPSHCLRNAKCQCQWHL